MTNALTAALALLTLSGAALADLHELRTFAGPYGVLGEDNPRNTTLTTTYTGIDGGTPYQANGLYLMVDLTSNSFFTYANETVIRAIPPSGPSFEVVASDEYIYDTIQDATVEVRFPTGVSPVGHATPPVTLIDRELFRFAEIWAAAGHPKGVFCLSPADLERLTGAPVADVVQG